MNKTTTLPTKQVREALKILAPVIKRHSHLDILKTVLIETRGQHTTFTATDLDNYAQVHFRHEMRLPLRICVPLDDLKQSVAAAADQCTLMAFSKLTDANEFPPMPQDTTSSPTIAVPTHPLLEAYASCAKDETRYSIFGVGLDGEYCVGTDGRRLYAHRGFDFSPLLNPIKDKIKDQDARPLKIANHKAIVTLLKTAESISLTALYEKQSEKGWLRLETPNASIISKLSNSNFPNWKMVVPSLGGIRHNTITATYDPAYALDALKSLPNIKNDGKSCSIEWKVRNGISSFGVAVPNGVIEAKFFSQANGELEICYNRDYLATALTQGFGEVHFIDGISPAEFQKPDALYVLMPVRKSDPVSETEPETAQAA
jgi:DNA polymerase III sliding clamp (beta) subunit (PCNA family)